METWAAESTETMIKPVTTKMRPALGSDHRRPRTQRVTRVRGTRRALLAAFAAIVLLLSAACGSGDSGETAKDFTLPSAFGSSVSLSRVLSEHDSAVLVFYRGSF